MVYTAAIIGSGIAGMTAALRIAAFGTVFLCTKSQLLSGSTPMAQGGVAVVTDQNYDSFASHIEDTLQAGGYENDRSAVEMMVHQAPDVLHDLQEWGIYFHDHLHKEGGHAFPRVLNVGDKTGKSIAEHLAKKVHEHPNIQVYENFYAVNVLMHQNTAGGIQGISLTDQKTHNIYAKNTVIATGGACALFKTSTVPKDALGDGIAMAMRASAHTKDLHRIQFHPTALDMPGTPKFLLSEALRGEGARIVNADGNRFIDELLPRDQVSKAIFEERKNSAVYLDVRHLSGFSEKFSKIFSRLTQDFHLDPVHDLLPIAPAAHYFGGGIVVDTTGKTSVRHLFASGECTYSGIHGRNRLASNSLLEGLVYSKRIAEGIEQENNRACMFEKNIFLSPEKNICAIKNSEDDSFISGVQQRMDECFGITRCSKDVQKNMQWICSKNISTADGKNVKRLAKAMWKEFLNQGTSSELRDD